MLPRHLPIQLRLEPLLPFAMLTDWTVTIAAPQVQHMILSLLAIEFASGDDGAGHVILTLAGDGAIKAEVEALEVSLKDVTRPYVAVSKRIPAHD